MMVAWRGDKGWNQLLTAPYTLEVENFAYTIANIQSFPSFIADFCSTAIYTYGVRFACRSRASKIIIYPLGLYLLYKHSLCSSWKYNSHYIPPYLRLYNTIGTGSIIPQ